MAQWAKQVGKMRTQVQIPRNYVKAKLLAFSCHPKCSCDKMGDETGDSLETFGSASLACAAANGSLSQTRRKIKTNP